MDFEHETIGNNHGTRSAELAGDFLKTISLSEEKILDVCEAIATHCYPGIQKTTQAKILWDADKLNMFSEAMLPEYQKYWMKQGLLESALLTRVQSYQSFYRNKFHTDTAKEIAAKLSKIKLS